jgi:hypothetical protein
MKSAEAQLKFRVNDGGRAGAGFRRLPTDDCVVRAIAIAARRPYRMVWDDLTAILNDRIRQAAVKDRFPDQWRTPRRGVWKEFYHDYVLGLGFEWVATSGPGSEPVRMLADDLPRGRLIVKLTKHVAAVINHTVHDTFDCRREGRQRVYGYYRRTK